MTVLSAARSDGPSTSLHQRILSEIEDRIISGQWPPGHRIPSEQDLTLFYACSRMTVNKALTQLVRSGLIERRRKAGSFVRRPHSQSAVLEIKDIRAEVVEQGLPYAYELTTMAKRRSRRTDQAGLGLTQSSQVLDLACRHFAARQPFCLEDRLINLDAVPEAAAENFLDVAPGVWLMTRVPWTAAEHRIRAIAADDETAAKLMVAKGTACLVVERRTWSVDRPITFVRLTYPGAAHELVARFAPSQA